MKEREEMETNLGRQISKLLRAHFGRGPQSAYVQVVPPFVTIYLQDFLAPMERTLWPERGTEGTQQLREEMMEQLRAPISTMIESETNHTVKEIYYDWNLDGQETANGMIWGVLDTWKETVSCLEETDNEAWEEKIVKLSKQVRKTPERVRCYWLGKNELLIEHQGLLLQIEKELIKKGNEQIVRISKKKADKKVFTKKIFQVFLQRKVKDVFVDWHFQEDKAYIIICLQKERKD